jgi:hypothetical protein
MKILFGVMALLVSVSAQAGTCDLISGSFKTKTAECYTIHNGVQYGDGYMEIRTDYNESAKSFKVEMVSRKYSLSYVADGKEQTGRPQFEGSKYTAQCENNQAHIRADLGMKFPLLYDYSINTNGKLVYQESFEGDTSFVRVCEMDRN